VEKTLPVELAGQSTHPLEKPAFVNLFHHQPPLPDQLAKVLPPRRVWITFVSVVAIALVVPWLCEGWLDQAQQITLGIFLLAAGLWVSEIIPPFATAITVIILQVFFLGRPGGPLGLAEHGLTTSYQIFINPIASPVIILFFGGFVLAAAASKYGVDRLIAGLLLRRMSDSSGKLLAGVIGITAAFSMFMSNTATAVMMFAILSPILAGLATGDPMRKGLCLAVAFAANLGGMGTLIGSPPNAVAASVLASMGMPISFLGWMIVGVPVTFCMLILLWVVLNSMYRSPGEMPTISAASEVRATTNLWLVGATFLVTVLLWMCEPLHAMPAPVVALVPILVFTTTGVLTAADLKRLDWDVLLLVAGGLSLGVSLQQSGLSTKLVELVPVEAMPVFLLAGSVMVVTTVLSNFMSNTSAANIMIPLVVTMGTFSPVYGAIVVAMSASLAMSLPISTPPNAVAYGRGMLATADMVRTGTIITVLGLGVVGGILWLMSLLINFSRGL